MIEAGIIPDEYEERLLQPEQEFRTGELWYRNRIRKIANCTIPLEGSTAIGGVLVELKKLINGNRGPQADDSIDAIPVMH